jgi:hypothetical protein
MRPFFRDDDFNFLTEIALGATYHQAADVGRCSPQSNGSASGHAQSWVDERTATADRLATEAQRGRRSLAFRCSTVSAGVVVLRAGDLLVRRDG